MPQRQRELGPEDWMHLFHLAHADKSEAFERYSTYYLSTDGQRYWSDSHQLSEYTDDYHDHLDHVLGPSGAGSEMITEIYVPRESLVPFMADVRSDLRASGADVIYGTIRFIEDGSFLPGRRTAPLDHLQPAPGTAVGARQTAGDFRRSSTARSGTAALHLTYTAGDAPRWPAVAVRAVPEAEGPMTT
jgi:hypothetical protein